MGHLQSVLATVKVSSQYMLIHLILGSMTTFTSATSPLRLPAIAIILGLALSIQNAIQHAPNVPIPLRGILAMGAWIQVFNSHDILVHRRINYTEHIEWKKERGSIAIGDAIWFALSIPNNFRRLDTKWQIIPVYSFDGNPGKIPTRGKFFRERFRSIVLICCTALFLFLICSYLDWIPKQNDIFSLLDKRSLLLNASWQTLPTQIHLFLFFIITIFLLHKAIYALLSVAAVFLHLSSPAHWPPFQASAREAWSIRRFWGFLPSNADFIISVFPLRPNTITYRYVRYFLCFFVSGMIHLLLDIAIGISLDDTGAMVFLPVQPIAFAVEDVAKYLSKRYGVLQKDTAAKRIIGYLWVVIFSFWSWRPWAYPVLKRALEVGEPITSTYFQMRESYSSM
ncbi:hypothetical protein N7510_005951 [Penicillium lagena]|uniref:uncharacterized protein n=1 Tax=Penicillium lagena TaxID=94218 RepID=UPI0025404580|nr:uncharacterized protein N7510_005951 [Penicillium lagena]KAJ5612757.1 hypothetical protein N7510_005951 [Penicillium lagena]